MFRMRTVVLLMLLVLLTSALAAAQYSSQTGSAVTVNLMAKNLAFDTSTITVPAGASITINFDNQDSGVAHNFAVYTDSSASTAIFKGDVITGPKTTTYTFTAPATTGTYFFRCDIHPTTMTGQFIVTSAGAVSVSPVVAPANVSVSGPTNVTNITITNTTNVTQQAPRSSPGFESIFVITGLMAVAYLALRRKP